RKCRRGGKIEIDLRCQDQTAHRLTITADGVSSRLISPPMSKNNDFGDAVNAGKDAPSREAGGPLEVNMYSYNGTYTGAASTVSGAPWPRLVMSSRQDVETGPQIYPGKIAVLRSVGDEFARLMVTPREKSAPGSALGYLSNIGAKAASTAWMVAAIGLASDQIAAATGGSRADRVPDANLAGGIASMIATQEVVSNFFSLFSKAVPSSVRPDQGFLKEVTDATFGFFGSTAAR
ncbi:MAG: hypothetical protein AAGJ92_08135, partial [Pseudomonadota bacterium]